MPQPPASPRDTADRNMNPVEITDGVFWVGFLDTPTGMTCNPYLVRDGDEAVLIDAGSRPDFPTVMMKVLQTGCRPREIRAVVYTHYDPDVCGSAANVAEILGDPGLPLLTARPNHMFIRHIAPGARFTGLDEVGDAFRFASGRELRFVPTPYAHSAGTFIVLDGKTGTLFSSDLFGSYEVAREPITSILPGCVGDARGEPCPHGDECPVPGILDFHRQIFPSRANLAHALATIRGLPFERLAPQHGGVIADRESGLRLIGRLLALEDVGIDGVAGRGLRGHFLRW